MMGRINRGNVRMNFSQTPLILEYAINLQFQGLGFRGDVINDGTPVSQELNKQISCQGFILKANECNNSI